MMYECVINIKLNPVREAESEEEFIENLIEEYNDQCFGLFHIDRSMITEIKEY